MPDVIVIWHVDDYRHGSGATRFRWLRIQTHATRQALLIVRDEPLIASSFDAVLKISGFRIVSGLLDPEILHRANVPRPLGSITKRSRRARCSTTQMFDDIERALGPESRIAIGNLSGAGAGHRISLRELPRRDP